MLPMLACIHNFQLVIRNAPVDVIWTSCALIRDPSCGSSSGLARIIRHYILIRSIIAMIQTKQAAQRKLLKKI